MVPSDRWNSSVLFYLGCFMETFISSIPEWVLLASSFSPWVVLIVCVALLGRSFVDSVFK